jgi:hypothetical protein
MFYLIKKSNTYAIIFCINNIYFFDENALKISHKNLKKFISFIILLKKTINNKIIILINTLKLY